MSVNNIVYMAATTKRVGRELFRSVAGVGKPTMVADIVPGPDGSSPYGFVGFGKRVYFAATTPETGHELFVTDGTAAGTRMVKDIDPGRRGSLPDHFVVMGNHLYFAATTAQFGRELWKTDGTAKGTVLVKDLTLTAGSTPEWLTAVGNTLFFSATTPLAGTELFKSDGTAGGTHLVKDIASSKANPTLSSSPGLLQAFGNKLLFVAADSGSGREPFISDGTAKGTVLLRDIKPGKDPFGLPRSSGVRGFHVMGKFAYFAADDGAAGGLWRTDGSTDGTVNLASLRGEPGPTAIGTDGKVLFYTQTFGASTRLYQSDGTAKGTGAVITIQNAVPGSLQVLVSRGRAFFGIRDVAGREPWVSDGTLAGTHTLGDLYPGGRGSLDVPSTIPGYFDYSPFVPSAAGVVFAANDGKRGIELWTSAGTAKSTKLLADINAPRTQDTAGSEPRSFTRAAGLTWFLTGIADLYRTDGTAKGTVRIARHKKHMDLAALGSKVVFFGESGTRVDQLMASDGTVAGTKVLGSQSWVRFVQPPGGMARMAAHVYFLASTKTQFGLWRTDGKNAAVLVKHLPGFSAATFVAHGLTRSGDQLFFTYYDVKYGAELWRSDGTAAGTKLVRDINPGSFNSSPRDLHAIDGGRVVFAAVDPRAGAEPFVSDGTSKGTFILRDINVGRGSSGPGRLVSVGDKVFFAATDRTLGRELFVSDGTVAGTRMVRDINPGLGAGVHGDPVAVGGRVFFSGSDARNGVELWASDGTAKGTVLVKDVLPGTNQGFPRQGAPTDITPVGDRCVFKGRIDETRERLFVSDGTAAGTVRLEPLFAKPLHNPLEMAAADGRLYLSLDDPAYGREPWVIEPLAAVVFESPACGASSQLSASAPRVGGAATVQLRGAAKSTAGLLVSSLRRVRPQHVGFGCDLLVDPASTVYVARFKSDTKGGYKTTVRVPNMPVLFGQRVPLQAALGPTGQAPLGLDLSNGLLLTIGF